MFNWNQRQASQGSRAYSQGSRAGSYTSYTSQASHASHASARGSQPRELEFQFFIRQTEVLYPPWWTRGGAVEWYRDLPDDTLWNCYVCAMVLLAVVWQITSLEGITIDILDVIYNISYAIHIFAIGYKIVADLENTDITFWTVGSLSDYNLKGSILGTTLKFCYIFLVLRVSWGYVWLHRDWIKAYIHKSRWIGAAHSKTSHILRDQPTEETPAKQFIDAVYIINKLFIPIGPPVYPSCDVERVLCLFIMMSGVLVVTGSASASMALIISLYMRPEESFRARYRLIMKEMRDTNVPEALRSKVETFYKMYWHKQRAVSSTQLLPTFPPTLPATINADIYFEATQKARILRELSYQLLSEIAKSMETIHYIPGDAIIKRGSKKCNIIYITYGDVEMLTAEDDHTAILRLTRGSVLTPCAGGIAMALTGSHVAVRAATFCTAHVLSAANLWRIVYKHSVTQDHAGPILAAFTDHVERVKRHYGMKVPDEAVHKSSILHFNRNLMALKEMKNANGELLLASSDVFLEVAGCYIMRNRPETTLTDQSDEICLRPTFPCILQPTSSLLFAWHLCVGMLILVVCLTHPYYLVFKKTVPLEFRFFDYATTGIFIVDHIVHLSTGANVEEGVPINFAQTSSQQMRSHWFVMDVVATLPIFEFIGNGHFAGMNKLLRLPKFFKVLKNLEEVCVYRSNVIRFLSYTMLLLIACYIIAAMQHGFMCHQSGFCMVTNLTHSPFYEKKPLDTDVKTRLDFGLYWAISMINFTIHRETWGQDSWTNVIFTLVILELCIVLRIFMEAVYSATIMVTTALGEDYGSRIGTVKHFLIRNEIDPVLRKRFMDYLQLCWYTDKAYKLTHKHRSTIFYDLPAHVFQDIVGRNRSKYINCIPFLKLLKKEDLRTVSSQAKLYYTSPNEILLNTGELTNEMYIIKQGICEILDPITQKRIGTLTTKNHFGALICLLRLPAYNTIRAITHVQLFCISRKYLMNALETPQIKVALDYLKNTPEFHRLQDNRMPAFVKFEPPPPTPNLMRFRLMRKHEPDTEFLQPFNRLGFLSILRYIFPRFTIRPDGRYLVRYEWFRATCAFTSAMIFPHYVYLKLQWQWLYYVTLFLDLSAWYDIFQRMLIGYYNDDGILVYHPASTAAYYIKGPFLMDLFGVLGLEDLETARKNSVEDKGHLPATLQFLMFNRLIQLYRLPSAMMVLKEYIERRDVLMVFKAMPIFMGILNVMTSLVIFYSVDIFYQYDENSDENIWILQPIEDRGGSWIYLFHDAFRFNLTENPWSLHLSVYFWMVYETSTTGYGNFLPSNNDLLQILFVGMACCSMFITYFSVRIISMRANVNKSLAGFQQHLRDINAFMAREKLENELQREVRLYYEYNWERMGGIDYRGVLKLCDQITLRTDAILHIYGPTFHKCPLLKDSDVSLLRIIGRAVRSMYFLRDMKILEHDDMVTDMYFVDNGGVEIRVTTGEMSSILRLPKGSIFGNLEGTAGNRSPYNVVSTSRLHLMTISSLAFKGIMDDFPSMKALMDKFRGPQKKGYILGSEVQAKLRRNAPTVAPFREKKSLVKYIYFEEGLVRLFLIAVCLGCIYLDLYNAGFQDNRFWMFITLYSLDFCFFLKIFMQHALPLLVMNRNVRKLMMPIRRMYFKKEFKYDLISILPFELFCLAFEDHWFWFAWFRLNRGFRITTLHKCLTRRNEKITTNLTLTTMSSVLIWFTLFVHTVTCFWYYIGTIEDQKMPNSSWMYDNEDTPFTNTNLYCDNLYICSLYFIITTFTQNGVGDIMPKKHTEVLFVSLLMILATMVFMVYVGEFSNILQYQSYRSFSFYSKYLELQEFMHNNRVSKNLVRIVNKYTLHLWRETRGMQVPQFLKSAPLSLRLRVMSATYLHHITRHHIFEECEPAFLRQLVGCIQLFTYNEDMYVVKESEITNSMYVIHTGKVRETCEDMDILARVYPAGSYFGILQGLVRNTPYTHSYQTMCKSQVLTIHLDDWEYLLKHFPDSRDAIHKHMRQVGDKDMDQSNWPGGAPAPEKPLDYEPLSEITGGYPGPGGPYPAPRRRSSDEPEGGDAAGPLPSSLRRASAFAWPTDSRNADDEPIGFVPPPPRRSDDEERGVEHATAQEERPKLTFFQKFAITAKKLMGKESDTDVLGGEGRDELMLEEDEEATEALLAQFEAAKRLSKDKHKKIKRGRAKSIFQAAEDEDTEKHMLTLDMEDTDELQQTDSGTFQMRPLRIRDEEDDNPEVLNLGLSRKSRVQKHIQEDAEGDDMESEDVADAEKPKTDNVGSSTRLGKDRSFNKRPILFDPTALPMDDPIDLPPPSTRPTTSATPKPFSRPKMKFPGASSSKDQGTTDTATTQESPSPQPEKKADRDIADTDADKDRSDSVSKPSATRTTSDENIDANENALADTDQVSDAEGPEQKSKSKASKQDITRASKQTDQVPSSAKTSDAPLGGFLKPATDFPELPEPETAERSEVPVPSPDGFLKPATDFPELPKPETAERSQVPDPSPDGFLKPATDFPELPEPKTAERSEVPVPSPDGFLKPATDFPKILDSDTSLTPTPPTPGPRPPGDDKDTKKKTEDKTTTEREDRDEDNEEKPAAIIHSRSTSSTAMTGPSLATTPFTTSGTSKSTRSSKTPDTAGETDRSQYDADLETPATSATPSTPGTDMESDMKSESAIKLAASQKRKLSDASSTQVDTREEGTKTSASNLNRRFLAVRYDEEKDGQQPESDDQGGMVKQGHLSTNTTDSDEPSMADKSVGSESEEDDEGEGLKPKKIDE